MSFLSCFTLPNIHITTPIQIVREPTLPQGSVDGSVGSVEPTFQDLRRTLEEVRQKLEGQHELILRQQTEIDDLQQKASRLEDQVEGMKESLSRLLQSKPPSSIFAGPSEMGFRPTYITVPGVIHKDGILGNIHIHKKPGLDMMPSAIQIESSQGRSPLEALNLLEEPRLNITGTEIRLQEEVTEVQEAVQEKVTEVQEAMQEKVVEVQEAMQEKVVEVQETVQEIQKMIAGETKAVVNLAKHMSKDAGEMISFVSKKRGGGGRKK